MKKKSSCSLQIFLSSESERERRRKECKIKNNVFLDQGTPQKKLNLRQAKKKNT